MDAKYIAKPTTFNGVRFRSKSEAIFAVALSTRLPNVIWEYEPTLEGFDYAVDFLLFYQTAGRVQTAIIEYKPAIPADTFVENSAECYQRFITSQSWLAQNCTAFSIVYGSPFRDAGKLKSIDVDSLTRSNDTTWDIAEQLQSRFIEATSHRFDLAQDTL